jgi:DNA (cytosine-5)-methyltransferase 1
MLRIGTDCSGIEAPIQALQQLDIPFEHSFSCEKDKYALQSIKANYHPKKIYHDITKRKHALLPDIDIYVCGFPCQPFSLMGNQMGTEDSRSNIMYQCIKVIQKKLPKVFILENVKNFKFIQNGQPFNYLIHQLTNIKNKNKELAYNIYHDILNTKNYGIPQNRERIFIIGIRKDVQKENTHYTTPEKLPMRDLDDFILDKQIYNTPICKSLQKNLDKINYTKNCIITPFTYYFPIKHVSPTLTTKCAHFYLTSYNRKINIKEALLLQGFPINFIQVISNTQMFKQIGNSMSVNVLKVLFQKIFNITNIN